MISRPRNAIIIKKELSFSVAVIFVQSCAASPAESNVTSTVLKDILEDEAEELLENMNLTMFKERYRRLIPYMAFYVANNNVHQTTLAKNYANDLSGFLLQKLPPQNPSSRLNGIPKRGNTNYHVNSPNQDKKFIPSIQYDPRNIGGDNDYFTPVKYSNNINYPEYSTPSYQLFQVTKAYPEITTHSSPVLQKNNRYFTTRPLRLPVQSHFIKKPVLDDPQTDYNQNYATRTNTIVNYPNKNYAGPEYIPSLVHQHMQKPLKLYESVRRPSSQLYRKPNVNLNNIIESFQLTEQLPETLNSENIDNSIKTLLEIFKILHSPRKEEEFIQSQGPSVPSVPLLQPKLINYNNYKPKMYTRPKVITEMTFQATLSPLIIPDDSERYKATPYTNDVPIKIPSKPVHSMNKIKQEKIEYYIPYVQDIPSEPKQIHKPLTKPADTSEKHSYQISEDLSDDILNNEQYTLPISTETPVSEEEYQEPNDVALPLPRIPQTSLKYGATRGKPNVDYPAYADIPKTDFNCKEQRYKGFFGDPATGCQVSITFYKIL